MATPEKLVDAVIRAARSETYADSHGEFASGSKVNTARSALLAAMGGDAVPDDPNDLWDDYCEEVPADRRSPQGALAFAFERLAFSPTPSAIAEGMVWQTMDSAPKDGTMILVCIERKSGDYDRRVFEGRWNNEEQIFTSANGFWRFETATLWRPLPPAPGEGT